MSMLFLVKEICYQSSRAKFYTHCQSRASSWGCSRLNSDSLPMISGPETVQLPKMYSSPKWILTTALPVIGSGKLRFPSIVEPLLRNPLSQQTQLHWAYPEQGIISVFS